MKEITCNFLRAINCISHRGIRACVYSKEFVKKCKKSVVQIQPQHVKCCVECINGGGKETTHTTHIYGVCVCVVCVGSGTWKNPKHLKKVTLGHLSYFLQFFTNSANTHFFAGAV